MKHIYRVLVFLIAISVLIVAADKSGALAQTTNEVTGFKNVRLWVNAEYDDPRLLVMMEGQIVGAQAPAEVRFLVPATAQMYSAGSMDAQGKYSGGPPNRQASSIPGWDEISYTVTTGTFRVEYYDTIITGQPDKTISYEFRRLYPIANLDVYVQVPRRASNFTVSPAGKASTDSEGFATYVYNYSGLDTATPLRFDISYTKTDSSPSLTSGDTGSGASDPATMAIIAITVGAVIVGGFLWIRKSKPRTRAARRQLARATSAREPAVKPAKGRFCTQCGERIEASDRFCPHCGKKL